jgi:DNA polymerase-1
MIIVLDRRAGAPVAAVDGAHPEPVDDLAAFVAERERDHSPRWVWGDTSAWYPELLAAGVRVERCFDLRLCHAILRASALTAGSSLATAPPGEWDTRAAMASPTRGNDGALFDLLPAVVGDAAGHPDSIAEYELQRAAVAGAAEPGRIDRLLAAESAGALIAVEMRFAGLPWSAERHDAILTGALGPRPSIDGTRPEYLQRVLDVVRDRLDSPELNPDSPVDLIKALGVAGMQVTSTRSWELKKIAHPAIEPLLEYKKLARLLAANGWSWLDEWVVDGRFRPDYVPGGTATGRWASSGGGALQLPRQIRGAVVADDGWTFVVADASQLEPRILAAMSGDRGMIAAGAAGDLYAGIVASGAVETRDQAKVAMLGAMYGATTGESGRLMPKLARAYPAAIQMVEDAARAGERGEIVTTRLGRSSPPPPPAWRSSQADGYGENATATDASRARGQARSWGRFTRNFIVQGTAAEWALCWMASVRRRLHGRAAGRWLTDSAHLVFFLHDEIVVHCPVDEAEGVALEVREAAAEAGRLVFGALPGAFPLTVAIVDNYEQAK